MLTRDENHVYLDADGKTYLSVTQHIQIAGFVDFSMVPAGVLQHACDRGSYTHQALNMWIMDDLDLESMDGQPYEPYVRAGIDFLSLPGVEVLDYNIRVHSERLRTAGEIDALIVWQGRKSILDWKTPVKTTTSGLQLAGYQILFDNPEYQTLIELRLKKNGQYSVITHNIAEHRAAFEQMVKLNWYGLAHGLPNGASGELKEICKHITNGG